MKRLTYTGAIVALALSAATFAYAQQQEKEFTLKVTLADINLISDALGQMPFKQVAPLWQKLQIQIQQQNAPAAPTPAPAPQEPK